MEIKNDAEVTNAVEDAFARGARALVEAKRRPCAFCGVGPRAIGDHYCRSCRHNVNETRRLAGIDVEVLSR